jgi:hypothetical protein
VKNYLVGRVVLADFKSQVDSLNKRHGYWGFSGVKGQMFFNMLTNTAVDKSELDRELRQAIAAPISEDPAKAAIKIFASYATRLGDQFVAAGGGKQGRPKVGSVPYFLSFFWQIQDRLTWPVYYTNTVNTLGDLNFWQPTGDLAEDYIAYKHVHEELCSLFTEASGQQFGLYEVEHVFWFKGGHPYTGEAPFPKERSRDVGVAPQGPASSSTESRLQDSYVPPIVATLPSMARNDPRLQEAAKRAGTSDER